MHQSITIEWDEAEVSHVSLDRRWRDGASQIAAEITEQFNSQHSVELIRAPKFGPVADMSIGELSMLRELLDAYNTAVDEMAKTAPSELTPGQEYREEPMAVWYANNRIIHLEIPADWLAQAPAQAVGDKLTSLLRRLPRTETGRVDASYLKAVADLENFWGGTS